MDGNVRLTWDFVKSISESTDVDGIRRALKGIGTQYGMETSFGGVIPAELKKEKDLSKLILVADVPLGWTARYLAQGYVHQDPVLQYETRARYFSWDEAYNACKSQENARKICGEARDFGMAEGFVVSVQMLDGNHALMSYGGRRIDISDEEKNALAFATNFAVGQLIYQIWQPVGDFKALTARETDCLLWASEGKTDWEISVILGIAVSTIEKHMCSARIKLCAVNKHHAIAKAMRFRLIK